MTTSFQINTISNLSLNDLFLICNTNNGGTRKVSANAVLQFFQQQFASPTVSTTFATPATGFNIAVQTPVSQQQWLLLQPASTLATGTITLPLNTQTPDGTEILVTSTQQITALTIGLNGASNVYGAPTSMSAEDKFRLRFYSPTNSWYAI